MEASFVPRSELIQIIGKTMHKSALGRAASGIDRSVQESFDCALRLGARPILQARGYQVLGLNVAPMLHKGLTVEQQEVRLASYLNEVAAFQAEALQNVKRELSGGTRPSDQLTLHKGGCVVRLVFPEVVSLTEGTERVGKPRRVERCAVCDRFNPGRFFKQAASKLGDVAGSLFMGATGSRELIVVDIRINRRILAHCTKVVDKQLGTMKVPPTYFLERIMANTSETFEHIRKGKVGPRSRSYVAIGDERAETQLHMSIKLLFIAMTLDRFQKGPRVACHWQLLTDHSIAKDFHWREISGVWTHSPFGWTDPIATTQMAREIDPTGRHYGHVIEHMNDARDTYLVYTHQTTTEDEGTDALNLLSYHRDEDEKTTELEKSIAALRRRQEFCGETLVPALPASKFTGTAYEDVATRVSEAQRDALDKWVERRDNEGDTTHAFYCGPNVCGAPPPIDGKHPVSHISGFSRHMCKVEKEIATPEGTVLIFTHDKSLMDRSLQSQISPEEVRAWRDITAMEKGKLRSWLRRGPNIPAPDIRPNSMSQAEYEQYKTLAHTDPEWGFLKTIRMAVFVKQGEGGDRARFITMPGMNPQKAAEHQGICSHALHVLEQHHKHDFNFRNLKGCTSDGRAARIAQFVADCPEDSVVIGFDKGANDRTWTWAKWCEFERMVSELARELTDYWCGADVGATDAQGNPKPSLPGSADSASRARWDSTYVTVTAALLYFYLPSGVGSTGFSNRQCSVAGIAAAILKAYGEEAYKGFIDYLAGKYATPMPDKFQSPKFFTFVSEGIVALRSSCPGFGALTEGDDNAIKIKLRTETETVRNADGSTEQVQVRESNSEAVTYFTTAAADTTNECWEPAYVSAGHLNVHGGSKSCVEMCSSIVCVFARGRDIEYACVPKPQKRLDKLAWTLSSHFRIISTKTGKVGIADMTFHRMSATRCLSMCVDLEQCLFVRWVLLQTAAYHLRKLRALEEGDRSGLSADADRPLYADRSMEARKLEDATGYIGDSLALAFARTKMKFSRVNIYAEPLSHANTDAWMLCDPRLYGLAQALEKELRHLDSVASQTEITDDNIFDPTSYLSLFPLNVLTGTFALAATRLRKVIEIGEKEKRGAEELRRAIIDSVKARTSDPPTSKSGRKRVKPACAGSDADTDSVDPQPVPYGPCAAAAPSGAPQQPLAVLGKALHHRQGQPRKSGKNNKIPPVATPVPVAGPACAAAAQDEGWTEVRRNRGKTQSQASTTTPWNGEGWSALQRGGKWGRTAGPRHSLRKK